MTILHVIADGELAGGQLVALRLAIGARERGHAPLILSPTRGPFTERADAAGFPVFVADLRRLFRIDALIRLWLLMGRERVDLVHTHSMLAANVLVRIAARARGIPVVSHAHAAEILRSGIAGAVYRWLDARTARWCSRVLAVSDALRRHLVMQGYPEELVTVVRNGLDPPSSPPASTLAQLGLDGKRVIACVGRLEGTKGQRDLVEALPSISDAVALFIGKDVSGERAELERRAAELGIADRVVFTGVQPDVLPLIAACELLVLPSRAEGLPVTVLEAMAVEKPVVATAVGGTPEVVVDGETGILVPAADPEALGWAIASLLGDPERAQRMGAAGRRRLEEHFGEYRMLEQVLAVYDEAA